MKVIDAEFVVKGEEEMGQFTGPGEVSALQTSMRAQLANVKSALQRCATAGTFTPEKTPGDWESWQSLKTRVEAYVAESPAWLSTASQYTRGEVLQRELVGWHERARSLGCDAGPAPTLPPHDDPILSTAGISRIAWLVILGIFLAKRK